MIIFLLILQALQAHGIKLAVFQSVFNYWKEKVKIVAHKGITLN